MRLVCPSCGAIASLEAWSADPLMRQVVATVADMPGPVSARAMRYIALFRPLGGRGLSWARAAKLAAEVGAMVAAGHVEYKGQPARPCSPSIWAEAIDVMLGRHNLSLPMENHNYLRSVAYDHADQADWAAETARNRDERDGSVRSVRSDGSVGSDRSEMVDAGTIARGVAELKQRIGRTI